MRGRARESKKERETYIVRHRQHRNETRDWCLCGMRKCQVFHWLGPPWRLLICAAAAAAAPQTATIIADAIGRVRLTPATAIILTNPVAPNPSWSTIPGAALLLSHRSSWAGSAADRRRRRCLRILVIPAPGPLIRPRHSGGGGSDARRALSGPVGGRGFLRKMVRALVHASVVVVGAVPVLASRRGRRRGMMTPGAACLYVCVGISLPR